jgi:autophagy-related protein 16-1
MTSKCVDAWIEKLKRRNHFETNCYLEFVNTYDNLNNFTCKIENELEQKKKELIYIQHTGNRLSLDDRRMNINSPIASSSPGPSQEVIQLKQKIYQLQEALTRESEKHFEKVASQIELASSADGVKKQLKDTQRALVAKAKSFDAANDKIQTLTIDLRGKEKEVDTFRDELTRLRVENKKLLDENRKVKAENDQLIQRIIDEKTKMAAEVNDMNQLYEKVRDNAGLLGKARSNSYTTSMSSSSPQRTRSNSNNNNPLKSSKISSTVTSGIGFKKHNNYMPVASHPPSAAVHTVCAHEGAEIYSVTYSDDGRSLATCGSDGLIKLWSSYSLQKPIGLLYGSDKTPIMDIDWVGSSVIGGSTDTAARIWDVRTQRIRHTLKGHRGKVITVKLSIDGKYGITGSSDRTIKIWDMKSGFVIRTIQCSSVCNSIDLGPDQVTLVSAHQDGTVRVWDMRNGNRSHEICDIHKLPVSHVEFSSISSSMNSSILLTACRDNKLRLFNTLSFEKTRELGDQQFRVSANWSSACINPDSILCAAGSGTGLVHIWDMNSGKSVRKLQKHGSAVHGCAWRSDGAQIATVDKRGYCVLWE